MAIPGYNLLEDENGGVGERFNPAVLKFDSLCWYRVLSMTYKRQEWRNR
jgi:hypothetical protein